MYKNTIKQELSSLSAEIIHLQSELETTSGVANNSLKLAEQLKKECPHLKEDNTNLKAKLQNTINQQDDIYKIIEDNKNRQLRKTLIFKGLPEQKFVDESHPNPNGTPKMRPENWDDTTSILATAISKTMEDTTIEDARQMIERCHRGAVSPRYKGTGPRPIFAAFTDWRDSEQVKALFRKINVRNNSDTASKVYVENKYGLRTTISRNLALKERKRF